MADVDDGPWPWPPSSRRPIADDWLALAGDVARLRTTTYDGITIEPLYTAADADRRRRPARRSPPFVRGRTAARHARRLGRPPAGRLRRAAAPRVAELERGADVAVAAPRRRDGGRRRRSLGGCSTACCSTSPPSSSTPVAGGATAPGRCARCGHGAEPTRRRAAARSAPTRSAPGRRPHVTPTLDADLGALADEARAVAADASQRARGDDRRHPLPRRRGVRRPGARRRRRRRSSPRSGRSPTTAGSTSRPPSPARAAPRRHRRPVRHDRQVPRRAAPARPRRRGRRRAGRRRSRPAPRRHVPGDDHPLRRRRQHGPRDGRLLRARRRRRRRDHRAPLRQPSPARRRASSAGDWPATPRRCWRWSPTSPG